MDEVIKIMDSEESINTDNDTLDEFDESNEAEILKQCTINLDSDSDSDELDKDFDSMQDIEEL